MMMSIRGGGVGVGVICRNSRSIRVVVVAGKKYGDYARSKLSKKEVQIVLAFIKRCGRSKEMIGVGVESIFVHKTPNMRGFGRRRRFDSFHIKRHDGSEEVFRNQTGWLCKT